MSDAVSPSAVTPALTPAVLDIDEGIAGSKTSVSNSSPTTNKEMALIQSLWLSIYRVLRW